MKNADKMIAVVIIILVVAAAVISISPAERKTLRIGYLPIVASLPLFIAQENGYFEDEGLSIETVRVASSNQLVDSLIAGNLEAYVESSAVPVLAAETVSPGNIRVFSVSDITPDSPFDSIITRADSDVLSLEGLAGKKIGVFPGSTATNLLKQFLEDKDIDTSKIQFIQIIPPNQFTALLQGSIDALHSYEPTTTIALQSGEARKVYGSVYAEQLNHNPQGVAALSNRFVKENPEEAQRLVAAFNRAFDFMREHEKEARIILTKYITIEQEVADNLVLLTMLRLDEIDRDKFQEYANLLHSLGELEKPIDTSALFYGG